MDRMKFVPGPGVRETIHQAQGRLHLDRNVAVSIADAFIRDGPAGAQPLLYQLALACLSGDETLEIRFGLRNPNPSEEKYENRELVGHTWATHRTPANANGTEPKENKVWEVGRATERLSDAHADRAFNAYRAALAAFQGVAAPEPLPVDKGAQREAQEAKEPSNAPTTLISHALAPSNLYFGSGAMWYFVDLSMTTPSHPDCLKTPAVLSRPMSALDALDVASVVTVALGSPPLVFGVLQSLDGMGKIPGAYQRGVFVEDPHIKPSEGTIAIIL